MTDLSSKNSPSRWPWKIYGFVLLFFLARKGYILFSSKTPHAFYYFYLTSFHLENSFNLRFYWIYFCNIAQTFLNIFHFIPLMLYVYRIRIFRKEFWQALLICKLFFDLTGHSFEVNYLVSLYHYRPEICLFVTLTSIATYIPLYIACFDYAFGNDNIQ